MLDFQVLNRLCGAGTLVCILGRSEAAKMTAPQRVIGFLLEVRGIEKW
jgi:hypothetical protein